MNKKCSNTRGARTYINRMNENDTRKLQLLLCVALINKSDTQRRVLEKIKFIINKNDERKKCTKNREHENARIYSDRAV